MQQLSSQRWQQNIERLLEAVEKVAGYSDKKEILQTTAITMVYLLHAETALVSTWDSEQERITPEAFHTAGEWRLPSKWYSPKTIAGHPLFKKVFSLRRSSQFNLGGMSLSMQALKLMEDAGIQSWIAFPMLGSDQNVLGVVDVLDSRAPRSFRDDEVALGELLSKLASTTYQRAIHLENSEYKARQLSSIVRMISTMAIGSPEALLSESLDNAACVFADVVNAEFCRLVLLDDPQNELVVLSEYDHTDKDFARRFPHDPSVPEDSTARRVLDTGTAAHFYRGGPDMPQDVESRLSAAGARSLLLVPLQREGQPLGLVELLSVNRSEDYSQEELDLLGVLAGHTVRALRQIHLQEEQLRSRRFSEALVHAARAMNSSLNLNEVLVQILGQTTSVMASRSANIMIIERDVVRVVKHHGYEEHGESLDHLLNARLPLDTPPFVKMLETRKPFLIEDTADVPGWVVVAGNEWIRSYAGAPLLVGGEVIGFLNLDSDTPGFFTEEVTAPLEAFASIASSVVRNAQRYQSVQDRAMELETVRQATLSLSSSLNLETVLTTILKQSLDLFTGPRDGHIFLYQNRELQFGTAMMGDGTRGQIWAEPREDGLTYTVARSGKPIIVDDMRNHPLFRNTPEDWVGSIIGLPLKYGKMVVGVMNIAHQLPYQFKEQQIRVLNLLADQAAISIVNARLHKLVQEQSLTDPLSRLNNRRAFDIRLVEEVQRSERYNRPFTLAMMDLNGFKTINDTFGHPVGDQILRTIGRCLKENVRNTDFLARYGGDEFALIMPETPMEIAQEITGRLARALSSNDYGLPFAPEFPISISIGIAQFPDQGNDPETLITAADKALYAEKSDYRENK